MPSLLLDFAEFQLQHSMWSRLEKRNPETPVEDAHVLSYSLIYIDARLHSGVFIP